MDLQNILAGNCKLDCDWRLHTVRFDRRFQDKDLYISGLHTPGLICNQNWQHIQVDNWVDCQCILWHKRIQRVHLLLYTDCKVHMGMVHIN